LITLGGKLPEIIFAKPVHKYDSYTDFWRLVELSGFPIINHHRSRKWRLSGTFCRRSGALGENGGDNRRAIETPERKRPASPISYDCLEPWIDNRFCDEVWVSDPRLADETMLRYVTLGSDYGLGEPGDQKSFDFTHMSTLGQRHAYRRVNIYKHFSDEQVGPNCWPPERDGVLKASKRSGSLFLPLMACRS
jgi:hypothetical protein